MKHYTTPEQTAKWGDGWEDYSDAEYIEQAFKAIYIQENLTKSIWSSYVASIDKVS